MKSWTTVFSLIATLHVPTLFAQQQPGYYTLPKMLDVFEGVTVDDEMYWVYQDSSGIAQYEVAAIFPIGWSEDGKFSYIYKPPSGETGERRFYLEVIALDTDTVIYSGLLGGMKFYDDDKFSAEWINAHDSIQKVLSKHNIVQTNNFKLEDFPIVTKSGIQIENEKIYLNVFNTTDSANYVIKYGLSSLCKGTKIVYSDSVCCTDGSVWNFGIDGYLKSPFDNRIVLIHTWTTRWACGGPPSYRHIAIIGTHLDYGFTK